MTKAEIINAVAEETGDADVDVEGVVDALCSTIQQALADSEAVDIHPLGRFLRVEEAEHTGTDPANGEPMQIPAYSRILFHPSEQMRSAVNGSDTGA